MNRNVLIGLVLILGVGGFIFYQNQKQAELQRQREQEEKQKQMQAQAQAAKEGKVTVLRANVNLPANTRILETAVREETIDGKFASENAKMRRDEIIDKFTTESIPKDDIINRLRLADQARSLESFLAEGERFWTLRIDGVSAVSGYVKQGDRVDVMAVMAYAGLPVCRTVLSNLEIFSINQYKWEISAEEKKRGDLSTLTVTFKLSGDQASRLIQLVQLGAALKLTLRPPSDVDVTSTPGCTLDELVSGKKTGMPKPPTPMVLQRQDGGPPMIQVEVIRYRDISKELFPITTPTTATTPADLVPLPPRGSSASPAVSPQIGKAPAAATPPPQATAPPPPAR